MTLQRGGQCAATHGSFHPGKRYLIRSATSGETADALAIELPRVTHRAQRTGSLAAVNAPPTLIGRDQVASLLTYVASLPVIPSIPLRHAVLRIAIVLLYTAGLRRGELARLTLADVATDAGVLRIRESKFHKSRWVPLSPSATDELRRYLAARHRVHPDPADDAPLLCRSRGRAFYGEDLCAALRRPMRRSGIWARPPRVHDFRHSFAVAALTRWYQEDGDVQANLPRLALYMGHVSIASTVYYLRLMPEVVALAGQRFERACGALVQGGAA